jgi:hypothetical protein
MNGIKVGCGSSSFAVKLTFISLLGGFRISDAPACEKHHIGASGYEGVWGVPIATEQGHRQKPSPTAETNARASLPASLPTTFFLPISGQSLSSCEARVKEITLQHGVVLR